MSQDKTPMRTLPKLTRVTRAAWPEYTQFDAAAYDNWPGPADDLYPNGTPMLDPDGADTLLALANLPSQPPYDGMEDDE